MAIARVASGPGLVYSKLTNLDIVKFNEVILLNNSSGLIESCWQFRQQRGYIKASKRSSEIIM